ncbi:MAG TPA: DUF5691 domain-containing protein [Chitinophagaceae bacterium]|nr:DUF5691 domain-containing protein [Chitinophagaceae bacterium]
MWHDVINTALLGTDKKPTDTSNWTGQLAEAATLIRESSPDKEEQFLQIAAVAFNYRQCGVLPINKEAIPEAKAVAEEKKYCSVFAMQVLKDILDADSTPLLEYWLQQCANTGTIARPDLLPEILTAARQLKKLRPLAAACCGRRGEWLASFNNEWNFSVTGTNEELWQTGSPEQRRAVLQEVRQADPQLAVQWLQQTWAQEDANTKTDLLQVFYTNLSDADIPFLESLASDKSKKVKEVALKLLKQIPSSSIVQQYTQALREMVVLKKEKSLLGFSRHVSLQIQPSSLLDESIFKSGIEKLSSDKEISDDEFVAFQLAKHTPPATWEIILNADPGKVIEILQKDKTGKKLLPAIIHSLTNFNEQRWAIAFMQHSETFYLDIIPLLPLQQQEFYSRKFIEQHADTVIYYATKREDEWSHEFAKSIFKVTAANVYQYNRSFYSQHIQRIPLSIAGELEKCTPREEHLRSSWSNMSEHIIKLLALKQQTTKAFNE